LKADTAAKVTEKLNIRGEVAMPFALAAQGKASPGIGRGLNQPMMRCIVALVRDDNTVYGESKVILQPIA
jgi:hypothetical protein